jgi:hypothetical protein
MLGKAPEDGKDIRRRRRARAHRRRRIWPRISADVRNSGDGFHRFGEELAREKKGGEGGVRGGYIEAAAVEKGLGFGLVGEINGQEESGSSRTPAGGRGRLIRVGP